MKIFKLIGTIILLGAACAQPLFAQRAADGASFLKNITAAVADGKIKKADPSDLAEFIAFTLQKQNPEIKDPEEIKRVVAKIESEFSADDEKESLSSLYYLVYNNLNHQREFYGTTLGKNRKLAFEYLVKSADLGHAFALENLIRGHVHGEYGIPEDCEKAIKYARKYYAESKSLPHQRLMGSVFSHQNLFLNFKTDPEFLVELLEIGADAGDIFSMLLLSVLYGDGEFVKKDEAKAESYRLRLAELKDEKTEDYANALYTVAWNSLASRSIILGSGRIIEYYSQAAELGSNAAINTLLNIYLGNFYFRDLREFSPNPTILNALKKYRTARAENRSSDAVPYPKELSDEFFRLMMLGEKVYRFNLAGELYFCFRDGIGGFEKDLEKAEALKTRILDFPENEESLIKYEINMFSNRRTFIDVDNERVIKIIMESEFLSEEKRSLFEDVKRELEENREFINRINEIIGDGMIIRRGVKYLR